MPVGVEKQKRSGRPVQAYLSHEIYDALVDYVNAQEVPPSLTKTVERALREFLYSRKFWPRRKPKP